MTVANPIRLKASVFRNVSAASQIRREDTEQTQSKTVSYSEYRRMRKHPTIKFLRRASSAPLLSNSWNYEGEDEERVEWIQSQVDPQRQPLLHKTLNGLYDFGWQSFEMIFRFDGVIPQLARLKPLYHDYTKVLVDVATGEKKFLRNEIGSRPKVDIPIEKCFFVTEDTDGEEVYGEGTLEALREVWDQWRDVNRGAKQYDNKIAGAHWIIRFPPGTTPVEDGDADAEGVLRTSNLKLAQAILDDLEASGSVVAENTYGELEDAGWKFELVEAKGGQAQFISRQAYLDKLLARGSGFTERSVFEGEYGTKAEAGVHMDLSILSMELKELDIACEVQTQIIDRLLVLRYGPGAERSVILKVAPLVDAEAKFLRDVYNRVLGSSFGVEEMDRLDLDAIRSRLNLPTDEGGDIEVTDDSSLQEKINAAATLIRSGFVAQDALRAVGLDPIKHTGLLPVTVKQ